jgi:hypothetical protein
VFHLTDACSLIFSSFYCFKNNVSETESAFASDETTQLNKLGPMEKAALDTQTGINGLEKANSNNWMKSKNPVNLIQATVVSNLHDCFK